MTLCMPWDLKGGKEKEKGNLEKENHNILRNNNKKSLMEIATIVENTGIDSEIAFRKIKT